MFDSLKTVTDRLLGRGSAAITVPVMDGKLLPNRLLDHATVLAELPGIDDLAFAAGTLLASAGPVLWRLDGGRLVEHARFEADITALAASRQGRLAVALGGRRIRVLAADGTPQATLDTLGGQPLHAVNALAWAGDEALLFTDGSRQYGTTQWSHDLMTLGRSGRAGRWWLGSGEAELLADGLAHAFGVLPAGDGARVSESWQHRVQQLSAKGSAQIGRASCRERVCSTV